jgi:hypothetical protein
MKFFKRKIKEENSLENLEEVNIDSSDIKLPEENFVYLPTNFVIGYYEGMTQKGLKEYINGYVFKYFNAPNVTFYRMLKYNAGYIFEIHDGDSNTSYLKKVINSFNNGEFNVIIKLQNRKAKVTKNGLKVTTYLLPESETEKYPEAIIPEKGKMKPIQTTGFGFVSFGIAIGFLGITSLFLSSLFKTVLSKNETPKIEKQIIESPSFFIEKLPLGTQTKYITKVWFENGKWNKTEKQIKTQEMIDFDKNNLFMSKVQNYIKFVEKCVSKVEIKECNDTNPFLDKINIQKDDNVKSISLKEGIITIDFKNNKDQIKLLPDFKEDKLIWNYNCTSKLATVCTLPNSKINLIEKNDIKNNILNEIKDEKAIKKPLNDIKEEIIKIDTIVKDPIKSFETKQKEIKFDETKKDDNVPSNLDLSEISDNIIIE